MRVPDSARGFVTRHARQRASVMTGHVKRLNLPLLARGATLVKLRRVKLRRPRGWVLSNLHETA